VPEIKHLCGIDSSTRQMAAVAELSFRRPFVRFRGSDTARVVLNWRFFFAPDPRIHEAWRGSRALARKASQLAALWPAFDYPTLFPTQVPSSRPCYVPCPAHASPSPLTTAQHRSRPPPSAYHRAPVVPVLPEYRELTSTSTLILVCRNQASPSCML
jgi:hypothetical protein